MSLTAPQIETIIRNGVPMANDIGFTVDETSKGFARARVPFKDNMLRPGGTISGPVIMALGDAAMYAAIIATLGRVEMAVTSNLNINFMQRPAATDLIAEAQLLKLGKRLAFCEVRLYSQGNEDLVAHVTGSYSLPPASSAESNT